MRFGRVLRTHLPRHAKSNHCRARIGVQAESSIAIDLPIEAARGLTLASRRVVRARHLGGHLGRTRVTAGDLNGALGLHTSALLSCQRGGSTDSRSTWRLRRHGLAAGNEYERWRRCIRRCRGARAEARHRFALAATAAGRAGAEAKRCHAAA